jgi:hypothetical protein
MINLLTSHCLVPTVQTLPLEIYSYKCRVALFEQWVHAVELDIVLVMGNYDVIAANLQVHPES